MLHPNNFIVDLDLWFLFKAFKILVLILLNNLKLGSVSLLFLNIYFHIFLYVFYCLNAILFGIDLIFLFSLNNIFFDIVIFSLLFKFHCFLY
jgi:hypothetical protein